LGEQIQELPTVNNGNTSENLYMKENNLQVMPSRKRFEDIDQNNTLQMRRSIKKINLQYFCLLVRIPFPMSWSITLIVRIAYAAEINPRKR
jgi:hypothetical protein